MTLIDRLKRANFRCQDDGIYMCWGDHGRNEECDWKKVKCAELAVFISELLNAVRASHHPSSQTTPPPEPPRDFVPLAPTTTKTYLCRHIRPKRTVFRPVEAPTPDDAANEFMFRFPFGVTIKLENGERCTYSIVEVKEKNGETSHEFIARVFRTGIYRRGGIKGPGHCETLEDVARKLEIDVKELEGDDWYGEEPYKR